MTETTDSKPTKLTNLSYRKWRASRQPSKLTAAELETLLRYYKYKQEPVNQLLLLNKSWKELLKEELKDVSVKLLRKHRSDYARNTSIFRKLEKAGQVSCWSTRYPNGLSRLLVPPPFIYYKGDLSLLDGAVFAFVCDKPKCVETDSDKSSMLDRLDWLIQSINTIFASKCESEVEIELHERLTAAGNPSIAIVESIRFDGTKRQIEVLNSIIETNGLVISTFAWSYRNKSKGSENATKDPTMSKETIRTRELDSLVRNLSDAVIFLGGNYLDDEKTRNQIKSISPKPTIFELNRLDISAKKLDWKGSVVGRLDEQQFIQDCQSIAIKAATTKARLRAEKITLEPSTEISEEDDSLILFEPPPPTKWLKIERLAIYLIHGLGKMRRKLIESSYTYEQITSGIDYEVEHLFGRRDALWRKFKDYDARIKDAQVMIDLHESLGVKIVDLWDEDYPNKLRRMQFPPLFLFVRGDLKLLSRKILQFTSNEKLFPRLNADGEIVEEESYTIAAAGYVRKEVTWKSTAIKHILLTTFDTQSDASTHEAHLSNRSSASIAIVNDILNPFDGTKINPSTMLIDQIAENGVVLATSSGEATRLRYRNKVRKLSEREMLEMRSNQVNLKRSMARALSNIVVVFYSSYFTEAALKLMKRESYHPKFIRIVRVNKGAAIDLAWLTDPYPDAPIDFASSPVALAKRDSHQVREKSSEPGSSTGTLPVFDPYEAGNHVLKNSSASMMPVYNSYKTKYYVVGLDGTEEKFESLQEAIDFDSATLKGSTVT